MNMKVTSNLLSGSFLDIFQFSTRIRDYDYLLEFKKYDTFLSVYKREYLDRFLDYLKNNTEAILYTTGEKEYVDLVMVTRKNLYG